MTEQEYRAHPGLSQSALKDLAVSPYRFWHKHLNPNAPKDSPSPEMQFGSALHCAVLEPNVFLDRYACELSHEDYPGCLVTIDDCRQWLKDKGHTPKGTRKADVIAQVQAIDADVPIMEVLERRHFAENSGKVLFKKEDWQRIYRAADSLKSEPRVSEILAEGLAEVPMFVNDPETGVQMKARMDWVAPKVTLDLKTFTQKRGKSIDQSIADAIFYERYYVQAYYYQTIRRLRLNEAHEESEFVIAFVESEEPHETRIRSLRPRVGGEVNLFWETARIQVRDLIRLYDECMKHFGPERPWRYAQEVTPLADEEMKALAFA